LAGPHQRNKPGRGAQKSEAIRGEGRGGGEALRRGERAIQKGKSTRRRGGTNFEAKIELGKGKKGVCKRTKHALGVGKWEGGKPNNPRKGQQKRREMHLRKVPQPKRRECR